MKTLEIDAKLEDLKREGHAKSAVKKAGIVKQATVHTLRHNFTTHLLMSGVNVREV